jgi:hypothetical protein
MSSWAAFESAVGGSLEENRRAAGSFALSRDEALWAASRGHPQPAPGCAAPPLLVVPLRFHIARGPGVGTDLTAAQCAEGILPRVNELWYQAGIQFELVEIVDHTWAEAIRDASVESIREQIWGLCRDPATGRMMGKEIRKNIFMNYLIGPENLNSSTYDVWFFDFIGKQSQGCCIDRGTRTVIMGRRSSKGYPGPTARPLACLGKTCAHEIGHALSLGHPSGQRFRDGTACDSSTGRNNLMTGGKDSNGGGGELLCMWQVLAAREAAKQMLEEASNSNSNGNR